MIVSYPKFEFDTPLDSQSTHIILAQTDDFKGRASHYQSLLSDSERQRFRNHNFVIARGLLRELLGFYLKKAPSSLSIQTAEKGKPYIEGSPLQFNVSHSHNGLAYIFSQNRPVGIDIEYTKKSPLFLKIARRFFSTSECSFLEMCSEETLPEKFFQLWTAKEAYAKAIGEGVAAFSSFEVAISKKNSLKIHSFSAKNRQENLAWQLKAIHFLESTYCGAYVIKSDSSDEARLFQL